MKIKGEKYIKVTKQILFRTTESMGELRRIHSHFAKFRASFCYSPTHFVF